MYIIIILIFILVVSLYIKPKAKTAPPVSPIDNKTIEMKILPTAAGHIKTPGHTPNPVPVDINLNPTSVSSSLSQISPPQQHQLLPILIPPNASAVPSSVSSSASSSSSPTISIATTNENSVIFPTFSLNFENRV